MNEAINKEDEDELLVLQMEITILPHRSYLLCAKSLNLAKRLLEDKKKLMEEIGKLKRAGSV